MLRPTCAAFACCLAVVLTACSGSDEPDEPDATPASSGATDAGDAAVTPTPRCDALSAEVVSGLIGSPAEREVTDPDGDVVCQFDTEATEAIEAPSVRVNLFADKGGLDDALPKLVPAAATPRSSGRRSTAPTRRPSSPTTTPGSRS